MKEIIVKNQKELDDIPVDFDGRIKIDFGVQTNKAVIRNKYKYAVFSVGNSTVEARDNSTVMAWGNSTVMAWDNSTVEAWGNSTVMARDNSTVMARDNSTVEAWDNSTVEAWGNSTVEARDNSSVEARDNSTVEAWDNSTVTAGGNAQVLDAERRGNIQTSGNARVVCNPSTIQEWADYNGIETKDGKIRLYKAVHGIDGKYVSDYEKSFVYMVGETAESGGFEDDPETDCGEGIHLSTLPWAAWYGRPWDDLVLLELEAEASEIVVPLFEMGMVRAPRAKVIREVPLSEAGILGEIIKRARKK